MLSDTVNIGGESGDAVIDAALVDFQPGFSRTAGANATREPREGIITGAEPGQHVFQLRHFYLQLAFPRSGPAGEDVQNELGAVNDSQVAVIGDGAHLRGREFLVEDEQICGQAHTGQHNFQEFALPHTTRSEERRVGKECRSRWSPYH